MVLSCVWEARAHLWFSVLAYTKACPDSPEFILKLKLVYKGKHLIVSCYEYGQVCRAAGVQSRHSCVTLVSE